jgi:hypothetical protein
MLHPADPSDQDMVSARAEMETWVQPSWALLMMPKPERRLIVGPAAGCEQCEEDTLSLPSDSLAVPKCGSSNPTPY